MHLMTSSHPMTIENQHWVMVPDGCLDENPKFGAQAVYAPSPEAAVESVRNLFRIGDFGEPVEPAGLGQIRLAVGEELPWNALTCDVTMVLRDNKPIALVWSMDTETIHFVYGNDVGIRKATAAEAEPVIRQNTIAQDKEDEEQFNYGFNVLYKLEQEERAMAEMDK
jgi:hypothetical protein